MLAKARWWICICRMPDNRKYEHGDVTDAFLRMRHASDMIRELCILPNMTSGHILAAT